jgi:TatD DNase family protein
MAEILVDTHCHIQSIGKTDMGEETTRQLWQKTGDKTAASVIEDAVKAGVHRLICVGCELEDSKLAIDFVSSNDFCFASIGLHPHESQHYAGQKTKLDDFAALVSLPKVVAIGECGLDYFYGHSPKKDQLEILNFQLELASSHNLPLIFHVREAFDDFWPIFDSFKGIRGVLHSFTDSADNLSMALERGLFIGVNGIATFAKSEALLEVYRRIPASNLLLETDSPFLTPVPYRGTINEPKNVVEVAKFLSGLRGETMNDLATATTANASLIFGI